MVFPVLLFSLSVLGQGQNQSTYVLNPAPVWEKAMVNAAGGNDAQGVDVFFQTVTCNSKKQIILKFVNNNDQDVLIEWGDGVYTRDKEWIMNERHDKTRELNLKANSQIEGSCDKRSEEILRIDLDQFIDDQNMTFRFAPSFIDVTK